MRPLKKKLVVVLGLAVLLVAAFWYFHPSLLGLLADHYYAQLSQAEDEKVEKLVDRLASLGTPAIPHLTAALGSERKTVAKAVRAKLLEMVKEWEHPNTRPSPKTQLALAESLVERMEQYSPTARLHAVTIARRMLQVSNSGLSKSEMSRLLSACESILDAAKSVEHLAKAKTQDGSAKGDADRRKETLGVGSGDLWPLSERSLVDLARLPGGNLPSPLPDLDSRKRSPEEGGGIAAMPVDRAREVFRHGDLTPGRSEANRPLPEGPLSDANPGTGPGLQRVPENADVRLKDPPSGDGHIEPAPRYAASSPQEKSEKPGDHVYALIVQLHSGDYRQAEQARRELTAGGFNAIRFALAEKMMDSDPEVRKEMISVLPRLTTVRAELWLKWLLRDDDPDVRYAALTTLASSSDPNLLAEIAQAARLDTDAKIRLEGEQIERRLTR